MLSASQASHAFLGRDKVSCLWPDKPVQIDGRAVEWSETPVLEESGLAFRAMNDVSNLYLLIRGANSDGRVILSGRYRQNVTLWFLKPDHKTKAWGINLDFGLAHPSETPTLAAFGIAPERVLPQGLEVSTAALPSDLEFAADLSSRNGRQPIYEIRIPLAMLEHSGSSIYMDFATSEIGPDVKAELQNGKGEQSSGEANHQGGSERSSGSGGSGGAGGGRHKRGGMGGSQGGAGASSRSIDLPKPLALHLTIGLTREPKH